jgi:hypothetical protein
LITWVFETRVPDICDKYFIYCRHSTFLYSVLIWFLSTFWNLKFLFVKIIFVPLLYKILFDSTNAGCVWRNNSCLELAAVKKCSV